MPRALRVTIVDTGDAAITSTVALLEAIPEFEVRLVTSVDDVATEVDRFRPHCVIVSDSRAEDAGIPAVRKRCVRRGFAVVLLTPESRDTTPNWAQASLIASQLDAPLLEHTVRYAVDKMQLQCELLKSQEELAESAAQLALAEESGCLATWVFDVESDKLTCSERCGCLYGRNKEPIEWKRLWTDWVDPQDHKHVSEGIQAALKGGQFDMRFRTVWPDGTLHWLRAQGKLLEEEGGKRLRGATTEITSTIEGNEKLQRSNSDLERFAYIASHDLQEPLRSILSFSELFVRRNKGIEGENKQYLDYIRQGGLRMQELVSDLLMFSRVVQSTQEDFETIDCNEVLSKVTREMQSAISANHAHIQAEPLPTLRASFQQFMLLLQNLFGNSLKFRRAQEEPVIKLSAWRAGKAWEFCISDNGIGFDMQYVDRIFEAFRRLHTRDQYAGSGLGLAVCKRIVERHGGRIWAESQPGDGAKFFFTISDIPGEAAAT